MPGLLGIIFSLPSFLQPASPPLLLIVPILAVLTRYRWTYSCGSSLEQIIRPSRTVSIISLPFVPRYLVLVIALSSYHWCRLFGDIEACSWSARCNIECFNRPCVNFRSNVKVSVWCPFQSVSLMNIHVVLMQFADGLARWSYWAKVLRQRLTVDGKGPMSDVQCLLSSPAPAETDTMLLT